MGVVVHPVARRKHLVDLVGLQDSEPRHILLLGVTLADLNQINAEPH
jgi:hypothetical protein